VWCLDFNWNLLYSVHVHVQLTIYVLTSDFEKLDLALGPRTLLLRKSGGGGCACALVFRRRKTMHCRQWHSAALSTDYNTDDSGLKREQCLAER
jgi:hypothetical protein